MQRLAALVLAIAALAALAAASSDLSWSPDLMPLSSYEADDEFPSLASSLARRALATTSYISYNALRRDSVPCNRRGASYYNCRAGAQANPYSRSCSAITRCRS